MLPENIHIPIAAVIYARRAFYRHYGIYVGNGRVVHFAAKKGMETDAENALIQETSLEDFAKGDEIAVEEESHGAFSPSEVVARAKGEVGKQQGEYSLVFNNCEHFANWCKYGRKSSSQVNTAVAVTSAVGTALIAAAVAAGLSRKDREE